MKITGLIVLLNTLVIASTATASGEHSGGHHGDEIAIGMPGKAATVTRTINIEMTDAMRFTPSNITAKKGETIKFIVRNAGKLKHEMVLGTEKDLQEHYEVMKKSPEMEHADANMVTVSPGKTGEIIWRFTKAGKVGFACLQPGHYDAGMKGAVVVGGKVMATATFAADAPQEKPTAPQLASASNAMTEGEIRKVDKDNKKITIKHGEIKNLDMPGMTMVFQVKDVAILDSVKAGDKIKFSAEKSGGAIIVTAINVIVPSN